MDGLLLPDTCLGQPSSKNSEGIISAIRVLSSVIINLPAVASHGHFLILGAQLHESPILLPGHVIVLQAIICKRERHLLTWSQLRLYQ